MSAYVCSCSCASESSIQELLRCAPCPPPTVSYEEFRDHALNIRLLLDEVCAIARRCIINGTDIAQFVVDCPPDIWLGDDTLPWKLIVLVILFALIMVVCVIYLVKRIFTKRYNVLVLEHELDASIELVTSEGLIEHFNEEKLIVAPENVTVHSPEYIDQSEKNIEQTHNLLEEASGETFYRTEEIITIGRLQLGERNQNPDDNEYEGTFNQYDKTEICEDKSVQGKLYPIYQKNLKTSEQLITETSVRKESDKNAEKANANFVEEEGDNDSYHSATED